MLLVLEKVNYKIFFFLIFFLLPKLIWNKIVKQAAKDVSYGMIVVAGGVLLVSIGYYLFSELFSRETPSGIYDESSKICLDNFEVSFKIGLFFYSSILKSNRITKMNRSISKSIFWFKSNLEWIKIFKIDSLIQIKSDHEKELIDFEIDFLIKSKMNQKILKLILWFKSNRITKKNWSILISILWFKSNWIESQKWIENSKCL